MYVFARAHTKFIILLTFLSISPQIFPAIALSCPNDMIQIAADHVKTIYSHHYFPHIAAGSAIFALEFGPRIFGASINDAKEFDIITRNQWIECKDWIWEKTTTNGLITKYQSVLKKQLLIAKEHNANFAIYSKQPISEPWKQWFRKQNIIFHEGSA